MKAYSFITGRGPVSGYGFVASSPNIPYSALWMSGQRASDTVDQIPIVEMHCAGFGKPVFISSTWVVDSRPFGYTEYMVVPLPQDEKERAALLENPGLMLNHQFITKDAFMALDVPGFGGQASLPVADVELPSSAPAAAAKMPEDMLACLLSDVWANSYIRISGRKYDPLRLSLSSMAEKEQAQQQGIQFLNQVILPLFPPIVRHTISVSVGAFWGSLPKGDNGSTPALAITLPEEQGFQIPGGYDAQNQQYTMRYQQEFSEVGRALIQKKNLEYYEAWSEALPNHPLLVNFFAVLSLVHIRLALGEPNLDSLFFAYRHYQELDALLGRDYAKEFDQTKRRKLLLQVEEDLVFALEKVVATETVYPEKMVEHLIQRAFSLRKDLSAEADAERLQALENAYIQILSRPGYSKEGNQDPPAFSLFTNTGLRDLILPQNPRMYYGIIEKSLAHAQKTPLSQWRTLLDLYRFRAGGQDKPRLAQIIADYTVKGLKNGFDIHFASDAQTVLADQPQATQGLAPAVVQRFRDNLPEAITNREKLLEAFRFLEASARGADPSAASDKDEQINRQLLNQVCEYIKKHPDESKISLQQLFSASEDPFSSDPNHRMGWLADPQFTEAVCAILRNRGQRDGSVLYTSEADLLIQLIKVQKGNTPFMIKEALNPLAAQPLSEETLQSLTRLLPFIYSALPKETPEAGWLAAWKNMVLASLQKSLSMSKGNISALLDPQNIWSKACPISTPPVRDLDELTSWHVHEDELIRVSDAPLNDALAACSQQDLSERLSQWHPKEGWFSQLLESKMKKTCVPDKFRQFLHSTNTFRDIQSMRSLLKRYNDDHRWKNELDAIEFVTKDPGFDLSQALKNFGSLQNKSLAGSMLGDMLLDAPKGSWNHQVEDVRLAMALMASAKDNEQYEAALPDFLRRLNINMDELEKMNPWDEKEGTRMLSYFLFILRWLDEQGQTGQAEALLDHLSASKFTKRARGSQKNLVFMPALGKNKLEKDLLSPSVAKWLDI